MTSVAITTTLHLFCIKMCLEVIIPRRQKETREIAEKKKKIKKALYFERVVVMALIFRM